MSILGKYDNHRFENAINKSVYPLPPQQRESVFMLYSNMVIWGFLRCGWSEFS